MATIATLLSGGECVGVGAQAAGLSHLWGFELHDDIAAVARDNGFNVITADVMTLDPSTLKIPDALHASPVCKRASGANQSAELNEDGTKEAPEDIAMGAKIASFIDVMTPRVFTLENVYAYRNFKAFEAICDALRRNGYSFDYWHLNAADYGVPQSRKRLILVAKLGKGQRIQKPTPTHHDPNGYDPGQMSMFEPDTKPWVGWYEAIADLIPGLPESQFADWQLARLPENLKTFAIGSAISAPISYEAEPIDTITLDNGSRYRAFITANGKYDAGLVLADESAPVFTVTANSNQTGVRAFVLDCQKAGGSGCWECGNCGHRWTEKGKPAACPNCNQDDIGWVETERGVTLRQDGEPMFTVTSGKGKRQPVRAWLVESKNIQEWGDGRRGEDEPATTVTGYTRPSHLPKAWLSQGRVVSMTPRALARFQSIPDSYRLPDNKRLACTVIGNGVCPLLYQKIIGPLAEGF